MACKQRLNASARHWKATYHSYLPRANSCCRPLPSSRRTTGPCSPSARASSRPWRPRARPQTSRRPALPQRWMCPNWKAQDGETRTWTWGWGMWGKRPQMGRRAPRERMARTKMGAGRWKTWKSPQKWWQRLQQRPPAQPRLSQHPRPAGPLPSNGSPRALSWRPSTLLLVPSRPPCPCCTASWVWPISCPSSRSSWTCSPHPTPSCLAWPACRPCCPTSTRSTMAASRPSRPPHPLCCIASAN
mmetsp:Transcript_4474/g.12178  ORF Transcript_4474/g.12178 Transcript_4474/m.12178 type:complete len:244 (+) Transcript_4474:2465-3196(+)